MICPGCGKAADAGNLYCSGCGERLQPPEADRRQLTAMFCEMADSAEISSRLDPEEWQALLHAVQAEAATVVERHGGFIAQYLGDGLLVYFGYPLGHEDDAERAMRAAIQAVERIDGARPRLGTRFGVQPRLRIGVHTGPVVVDAPATGTRREPLAVGDAMNLAARVQAEAEPGTVVASAASCALAPGVFELESLGTRRLRGVRDPVALFRVRAAREGARFDLATSRGLSPRVGREAELRTLRVSCEKVAQGEGQIVQVAGEPGIGKSRLIEELRSELAPDAPRWLSCPCSELQRNHPFHAISAGLRSWLGDRADPVEALGSLGVDRSGAAVVLRALDRPLPEGLEPPQGPPDELRERTLEALTSCLLGFAAESPFVLLVEDLHWADPSSLELLRGLLPAVAGRHLLLLLTRRPAPPTSLPLPDGALEITLDALDPRDTATLIESVAGRPLAPGLVEQLVARSDGVPLFAEEVTRLLLASGHDLDRPLAQADVPMTLQDSLEARLDQLGPAKPVAQVAAAIGREFPAGLLARVVDLSGEACARALRSLARARLIEAVDEDVWTFRHALVQETAYRSLLRRTRREIHGRIADALQGHFADRVEGEPQLLAHHATEAGRTLPALHGWLAAAGAAVHRAARVECEAFLDRGVPLLADVEDGDTRASLELTLLLMRVTCRLAREWFSEAVVDDARRAEQVSRRFGDDPRRVSVLSLLCMSESARGRYRASRGVGEEAVRAADALGFSQSRAGAWMPLSQTLLATGDLPGTLEALAQVERLDLPAETNVAGLGISHPRAQCLAMAALAEHARGADDRADAHLDAATRIRAADGGPLPDPLRHQAVVRLLQGREEEALECAALAVERLREAGQPWALLLARTTELAARVCARNAAAALPDLERQVERLEEIGQCSLSPLLRGSAAQGYARQGDDTAAQGALDQALAAARAIGERYSEAWLLTLGAERLGRDPDAAAGAAEAIGAYGWVTRARALARR